MVSYGRFLGAFALAGCLGLSGVSMAQDDDRDPKVQIEKADLSRDEINKILAQAEASAADIASGAGLRSTDTTKRPGKYQIVIVNRAGKVIGYKSQADAWVGSFAIAIGKARTAAFFSSNENALTSRNVGALSQAHGAEGTGPAGTLWGIGTTNQGDNVGDDDADDDGVYRNTLVTFPGGVPLYKDGKLVGAIGVSGDGVDQDEAVAFGGAAGFAPAETVGKVGAMAAPKVDPVK